MFNLAEPSNIKYFGRLISKNQSKKRNNSSFLTQQFKDEFQAMFKKTDKYGRI